MEEDDVIFPDAEMGEQEVPPSPGQTIRPSILDKVENVLWLDQLNKEDAEYEQRLQASKAITEKCMVCTLPFGTCEHTREWIEETHKAKVDYFDSNLEQQLDDMLSVIGDFKIDTNQVLDEIDLHGMQWKPLSERSTDKIGDRDMSVFSLDERGWQTAVQLQNNLVYVFGGFSYKKTGIPQPFDHAALPHDVDYFDDLRVYDAKNLAWFGVRADGRIGKAKKTRAKYRKQAAALAAAHPELEEELEHMRDDDDSSGSSAMSSILANQGRKGIGAAATRATASLNGAKAIGRVQDKPNQDDNGNAGGQEAVENDAEDGDDDEDDGTLRKPEGRYGHVAAALDETRMLLFGGRGVAGRVLNDTWIYHSTDDRWELIQNNEALGLPVPNPRFFSACCAVRIPKPSKSRTASSSNPIIKESDQDVYLFGGTDGIDNFGDLWCFRGSGDKLRWERLIAVGLPPCPRYGHQIVLLSNGDSDEDSSSNPNNSSSSSSSIRSAGAGTGTSTNVTAGVGGAQIMVIGGCYVSPQGEMVGSAISLTETQQLLSLSSELRTRYQEESRLAFTGGASLESNVLMEMSAKYGEQVFSQQQQQQYPHQQKQFESYGSNSGNTTNGYDVNGASILSTTGISQQQQQGIHENSGISGMENSIGPTMDGRGNVIHNHSSTQNNITNNNQHHLSSSGSSRHHTDGGSMRLGDVYHQASRIAGSMHQVEQHTRNAEQKMVDAWKISAATTKFNIGKARHPNPHLDVVILNVTELMWRSQIYPPIRGTIPRARIHFGASCIGHNVFVTGGAEPTSLRYKHVDVGHDCLVYTLDLHTMKWSQPNPQNSNSHLREPMRIAEADIIRAQRKCDEEKLRGMSYGALNGRTIEYLEAECVLQVCRWRKSILEMEQEELSSAPRSRFGASFLGFGQRMLWMGGWHDDGAVAQGKSLVLDVEHEHERRRRLDDEFHARLERKRIQEQAEANLANVQSIYELRAIRHAEHRMRVFEGRRMAFEDHLSSLPPLFQPAPVQFKQANAHTIWVSWPRLYRNSKRKIIDDDTVTYFLYVWSSYENLMVNERVYVTVSDDDEKKKQVISDKDKKKKKHHKIQEKKAAFNSRLAFFDDSIKRFPAEIIRVNHNGTFNVMFDDGAIENDVTRSRLKLAKQLDLSRVPLATHAVLSTKYIASELRKSLEEGESSLASAAAVTTAAPSGGGGGRPGTNNSYLSTAPSSSNNNNSNNNSNSNQLSPGAVVGATTVAAPSTSPTAPEAPAAAAATTPAAVAVAPTTGPLPPGTGLLTGRQKAAISSALLQASISSVDGTSVIPLEFSKSMRQRIQNRKYRKDRASVRLDAFRGVQPPTAEELEDLERQNRAVRRKQKRLAQQQERLVQQQALAANASNAVTFADLVHKKKPPPGGDMTVAAAAAAGGSPVSLSPSATPNRFFDEYGDFLDDSEQDYGAAADNINNDIPQEVAQGPPMTVQVDSHWQLVYCGNDNAYACSGLVSQDALIREPNLSVPVAFCLQVHGVDEPSYERSQLSPPVIFYTLPPRIGDNNGDGAESQKMTHMTSKSQKMNQSTAATHLDASTTTSADIAESGQISKTKKEIISAVVHGQMIQIERMNNSCQGYGMGDDFL